MNTGNLTAGMVLPGVYGFVDYGSNGGGAAIQNSTLLWGFVNDVGEATPNYPYLPASQQDADEQFGQGSDLARMYQASAGMGEAAGTALWCMPIVAPSGSASTYNLTVFVPDTNPAKPGSMQLWIASRAIPAVGFTTSDTASTIAASLAANILQIPELPIASVSVTGPTVTITYMTDGAVGEDLPMRCFMQPVATGVNLSPGHIAVATTAVGAGSVRVSEGSIAVATTLTNGMTAIQIAAAIAASFTADTYPLTAVVDSVTNTQVDLYFNNGYDVRRISAGVITTTGTTVNLGSGATDGSGSTTSLTYNGTQGVGAPNVNEALTNLEALPPFRSWGSSWKDSTTMGAMATAIENASDGSITGQKMQTLSIASSDAASVAGAIATASSPNLNSTAPHYAVCWVPEVPVQEYEIAARVACARASWWLTRPQKNWNGYQIRGSDAAPILAPKVQQTPDTLNTALRTYALAPIVQGTSGFLEITKGRTTSTASDLRLWAWSTEAQAAYHCVDLAAFLRQRFQGGSIVRYSTPKAQGLFDTKSVESAVQERMRVWETQGNYDGAALMAPSVKASINSGNPFRIDVFWPESPVLDLDQVVFVSQFSSPPSN